MTKPPMEVMPEAKSAQDEDPAVRELAIADSERLRKQQEDAEKKAATPKGRK